MIEPRRQSIHWPLTGLLVAIAAALGFGAAHWSDTKKAVPAAPAPVAKPEESAPAVIKIPAEYLKAANIAVEPVASGGISAEILAPGSVTALPNSEAVIIARVPGTVARINRRLGETIRAGETLALVESLEAATMVADRSSAQAKLELARKNRQREASLFEQGVSPRQDLEAAQAALAVAEADARRAQLVASAARVGGDGKSVAVVSPITGKVTAETVTLGAYVQPQTELFRVARADAVQVEAQVSAADIKRIAPGDSARIIAAGGTPVNAVVHSITPTVNGETRAATVVLTPQGAAHSLVVGEGAQVRLHAKSGTASGLVVPEDAVQNIDGRDVLFVRTADGFRPQPVLVGARSGGVAQIVSGVQAGEQVATRNAFLVKADMIKENKEE